MKARMHLIVIWERKQTEVVIASVCFQAGDAVHGGVAGSAAT